MVNVTVVLSILFIHWVADFVLQSDWMAINKSKESKALVAHVSVYSLTWFVGLFFFKFEAVAMFVCYTYLFHYMTDFITSRINAKLWKAEQRHWFFVMVGFDQVLHYAQLFLTYLWLV